MEDPVREESVAVSANSTKSKLRYPLRSASKSKEEKSPPVESTAKSTASRRARAASTVSKSMGVIDLSAKEKSAKPPRRLSIPTKSAAKPVPKPAGNITPISETRAMRSASTRAKSETPLSDLSRTSGRKKYDVLSSASYWITHIKNSESAAKHSISLGFFKLAFEAGCEPLQRMRDEVKAYARHHNLSELGELVKDVFDLYNISDTVEQLQVSETCSQVHEEGTRSSDDEVRSSSSTAGTRKLKPKSLNTEVNQVTEAVKKETTPKISASNRTRAVKTNASAKPVSDIGNRKIEKKPQKPAKPETTTKKDRTTKPVKKSDSQEGTISPPAVAETKVEANKENMDASSLPMEETEVI